MASVGGEGGSRRGNRRSLDAPINLVPYIDLMTVIITFLMMTAVWIQVSSLDVQAESLATNEVEEVKEEEIPKEIPKPVMIVINEKGFSVSLDGDDPQELASTAEGYDFEELKKAVAAFKQEDENRVEVQVFSADDVKYDDIIKVIDIVTGVGLPAVSLKALSLT